MRAYFTRAVSNILLFARKSATVRHGAGDRIVENSIYGANNKIVESKSGHGNYIVIGAGPVGLYLAYSLLKQQKDAKIIVYEGRLSFDRVQVIRIPFCVANKLPEKVKEKMWADEDSRKRLFESEILPKNIETWPRLGYEWWAFICVGAFQKAMVDNLQAEFGDRFSLVSNPKDFSNVDFNKSFSKIYPNAGMIDAAFCTCGGISQEIRKSEELQKKKPFESKGSGIYWVYRNSEIEDYRRNSKEISFTELGGKGITYAASNNSVRDVQIYTYPIGNLESVFKEMPNSLIKKAEYSSAIKPLTASKAQQHGLSEVEASWLYE